MDKKKYGFVLRFIAKTVFLVGMIGFILVYVLCLHRMTGNTMFPSIRDGDFCVFYRLNGCHLNDVVLYETPDGTLQTGRIIAIGGQTIEFMEEGGYQINGYQPTEEIPYETYLDEKSEVQYPIVLEEGSYFILNDFRKDTSDSRHFGPVKEENIKGSLLFLMRRRGF